MVICVTGHRPDKIYGYNIYTDSWRILKDKLKEILIRNNCDEAITGMALGVDTVFALAVLELQNEGYKIKLHCAIPCQGHASVWRKESVDLYNYILRQADIVKLVTDAPYQTWMMQKRNEYMVDLADKIIAVWDGSKGGTYNCVQYAYRCKKDVIRIIP